MEETESRIKYKYNPPHKVHKIFEDGDVSEIMYRGITYTKEMYNELMSLGKFEESKFNEILKKYNFVIGADFESILEPDDRFQITFDKFMKDISDLKEGISYMIKLTKTGYTTDKYLIRDANGNWFTINDNAKSGIENDIEKYFINRRQYLPYFEYEINHINLNDIEPVAKYYYYQEDYENTKSSGAGVLTGWITQEEAERTSRGKTLIKLNTNIRLKQKGIK